MRPLRPARRGALLLYSLAVGTVEAGRDMTLGTAILVRDLSKTFGSVPAVSPLDFSVRPGVVTGFLGPNGAGKTTTLRMILGLVRPTTGTATFDGVPYRELRDPLRTVGAMLENGSFHPGRTARGHLVVAAIAGGIERARIDELLALVGLTGAEDRRVGQFSMGMRQRLGLALALLGDPGVLILDEPLNGLDPEGIRWMRNLLRTLAAEGRTVLISSHLLSEVQQVVDDVLVISRGRLIQQGSLEGLQERAEPRVVVDSPDRDRLRAALGEAGLAAEVGRQGFVVVGSTPAEVGAVAFRAGVQLRTLHALRSDLEDSFLSLVGTDGEPAPPDRADGAREASA